MPSMRQCAEWGMRKLKASFEILRVLLTFDERRRYRLTALCVRRLNLQTRLVGLNQINSVYARTETSVQARVQRIFSDSSAVQFQLLIFFK